jgi:hypothetical protein
MRGVGQIFASPQHIRARSAAIRMHAPGARHEWCAGVYGSNSEAGGPRSRHQAWPHGRPGRVPAPRMGPLIGGNSPPRTPASAMMREIEVCGRLFDERGRCPRLGTDRAG